MDVKSGDRIFFKKVVNIAHIQHFKIGKENRN